jgi:hypothetical protein
VSRFSREKPRGKADSKIPLILRDSMWFWVVLLILSDSVGSAWFYGSWVIPLILQWFQHCRVSFSSLAFNPVVYWSCWTNIVLSNCDTSILIQFSFHPFSFLYDCVAYEIFYHLYSSLSSVLDCINIFSIPVQFEFVFINDCKIRLDWYITSSALQFSIIFVNSYVEHSIYHLYSSLSTFPTVFNSSSISSTSESSRAFIHFCLFHHLVRECLPCCMTVWLRNRKWFALFSFTVQLSFSRH